MAGSIPELNDPTLGIVKGMFRSTAVLLGFYGGFLLTAAAQAAEEINKPIVAVYDLKGKISEAGKADKSLLDLDFAGSRPLTMFDLSKSLEKAAADTKLKAVVFEIDRADFDFSQIQEVRRHLLALRAAGKDVWLYSEHLTNRTALLGSAANHFCLMPEADCEFNGIYAESLYFKGLFDKLGVRAEVIHIGDFKSFGENFYRTGPSEYAAKQEEALIDSIYQQVVRQVAEARKVAPSKVQSLMDQGALIAAQAVAANLADELIYRTDLVKKLEQTYGKDAIFDRDYEIPDLDGPKMTGLMDIFKVVFNESSSKVHRKDFIAVVALDGDITEESIAPVRTQILKLAKETKAKALLLRVNSPGGSALASELLWEATDEWNATGKPFAVSMGGVAASGGYYVASAADRIFAEAGTITGSIGVVGMKFVIADAMEKIGITTHTTQRGQNAGTMSMSKGFSEQEAKVVRESMTRVYGIFKKRITDGRGKALKAELESLAGGRVYSGEDALKIGLIDEIGGLSEAIAYLSREAKLAEPDVKLLPEPKSGLQGLFTPPGQDDDELLRAGGGPTSALKVQTLLKTSGLLEILPRPMQANIYRTAERMEAFRSSQILLIGPEFDLR
jgi:protease IV